MIPNKNDHSFLKHTMMKLSIILPITLFNLMFYFTTSAQQNTVASGGMATGSGGSVSYSIGQIDYITATGTGGTASQGVQQVYRLTINLKAYIQGYYVSGGLMESALANQGQINGNNDADTLTIELRDATAPYSLAHTYTGVLKTNGNITCNFPNASEGQQYYVVLKHRNALETWSANPITLSNAVYDFTTAANKAYGENQVLVDANTFAMYSGDLNQDENIDLQDAGLLDIDIANFNFGYTATDLNGDGNVDLFDYPFMENNINTFIYAIYPN